MRLILIIVAIAAAGFWGYGKVRDAFAFKDAKIQAMQLAEKSKVENPRSRKDQNFLTSNAVSDSIRQSLSGGAGVDSNGREIPKYSKLVKFRYRDVPSTDWISQVSSIGVIALVDPVGRSILLKGPIDAVDEVASALSASDVVPGSCGLQTFAVYVSKSVTKGFDLFAAINAVAGNSFQSVEIGGGSITLDVGADRLLAALEVIADGEAVEVVQRPHVRLLDRVPASVEAIDEIPIPATVVSQGLSQTSIDFRKVGLQLRVEPIFLDGNRVRLAVTQQNGVIGQRVKIEDNEIPVVQTQSVQSAMEIVVGQSIIFGGVRTYRKVTKRGLLRSVDEVEEGALYIILATYADAPRAAVVSPDLEFPENPWIPSPGIAPAPSASQWVDDLLLPPLDGRILPASKK